MAAPKYARPGHAYYSVSTPAVFVEFELPEDSDEDTAEQATAREGLDETASRHGTHVHQSSYRVG
jgi:hypothetical protein